MTKILPRLPVSEKDDTGSVIHTPKQLSGFTLVEIMIVVGLIMMFTAMGLGIHRQTDTQVAFFKDQAKVIHAVYRAREDAMAIRGDECGYGIRVMSGLLEIIKISPDEMGTCPDTLDTAIREDSIQTTSRIEGNFALVFMAPFGKQVLEGESPCFTLLDASGGYQSVIKINQLGTPYIDSTVQACN